jgi:hypothetical protein
MLTTIVLRGGYDSRRPQMKYLRAVSQAGLDPEVMSYLIDSARGKSSNSCRELIASVCSAVI